jgi:hypothetical protein
MKLLCTSVHILLRPLPLLRNVRFIQDKNFRNIDSIEDFEYKILSSRSKENNSKLIICLKPKHGERHKQM